MHPSVTRLTELLPPHPDAGDTIDWDRAAVHLDARLPADYRDFITVYGAGAINNSFSIAAPYELAPTPTGPLTVEDLTGEGYYVLNDDEPAPEKWIAWALDCGANFAFWNTADSDPDQWTVQVLDRYGEWASYDLGMADFLIAFLTGAIAQPMALVSPEHPVFVHWREEIRLRAADIDPWPHLR